MAALAPHWEDKTGAFQPTSGWQKVWRLLGLAIEAYCHLHEVNACTTIHLVFNGFNNEEYPGCVKVSCAHGDTMEGATLLILAVFIIGFIK